MSKLTQGGIEVEGLIRLNTQGREGRTFVEVSEPDAVRFQIPAGRLTFEVIPLDEADAGANLNISRDGVGQESRLLPTGTRLNFGGGNASDQLSIEHEISVVG